MSFDAAAVKTLFDRVQSHALSLGLFESVNTHEPKSAPGGGLRAAIWVQSIGPTPRMSGLATTSGVVLLYVRVFSSFLQQPVDAIDPDLLSAVTTLLGAYTGDFDLGGTAVAIDLLGAWGTPMGAQAGYLKQDAKVYRIMTITLPVVIDALWTQEA